MPNFLGSDLQVFFRFDQTGEWPPVPSEGLRVEMVRDRTYKVLEVPFFVRNIALYDVVSAVPDGEGVLWAGERVSWAGHQTLRVTPRKQQPSLSCAEVLERFAVLGVTGEELEEYQLVALDVPPDTEPGPVKSLLTTGTDEQLWWYEEACIASSWPA